MKKITILTLTLLLLASALCLTACPSKQDPMNTVAYYEHGFSLEQKAILRYEYNAQGKILNILVLDWNTLFPAMKADKNDFDISYRYDSTGKLISHTFHGANMVLEYDENGHVKHSEGYRVGQFLAMDYTCDENGAVRAITLTRGKAPYSTAQTLYEYTEDGKLLREGGYEYTYEAGAVTVSSTGSKPNTYRIELNEASHIQHFSLENGKNAVEYDWSYDESGACTMSEGYSAYLDWEYPMTCTLTYDKKGRLVDALTEVHGDCPTMRSYTVSYEYGKDGLVSRSTHEEFVAPENTTQSDLKTVKEYVGDRLSKSTAEHFPTESRPYTTRTVAVYDPATGHLLTGNVEFLDGQGNPVKPESGAVTVYSHEYDEIGRHVYRRETVYSKGEIYNVNEYFWRYNEQGDIDQTVEKKSNDYNTTLTTTTDYEGGTKTKETLERYYDKTVHELAKDRLVITVMEYNALGITTRHHTQNYDVDGENKILRANEETQYDLVPDNGVYRQFTAEIYDENGEWEQTISSVDAEDLSDVTTTCYYENGVVRRKETTTTEWGRHIREDESWTNTRVTDQTVEYFDATGKLEKTEVNEYEYHETNYRAKHTCRTYDADGNLLSTVVYEYDEAGQLIEK